MAETREMTKQATIETSLGNAAATLAKPPRLMYEGLICARQGIASISEAEARFAYACLALKEVESKLAGESGLSDAKTLLLNRTTALTREIEELQLMQKRISGYKEQTETILMKFEQYVQEVLVSVFGEALKKQGAQTSERRSLELALPENKVDVPKFNIEKIMVAEPKEGSLQQQFLGDMEPFRTTISLLNTSRSCASSAEMCLAAASSHIQDSISRYSAVYDSIEADNAPAPLATVRESIANIVSNAQCEREKIGVIGKSIEATADNVVAILGKAVENLLMSAARPKTADDGRQIKLTPALQDWMSKPLPAIAVGNKTLTPAALVVAPVEAAKVDTPAPVVDATKEQTEVMACIAKVSKGDTGVAVGYLMTNGSSNSELLLESLKDLATRSSSPACAIEALKMIVISCGREPVGESATKILHEFSQDTSLMNDAGEAAKVALEDLGYFIARVQ